MSCGCEQEWPALPLTLRHSDIHVYYMQSQLEYARQLYDRIRRECKTKSRPPAQSPSH